METARAVYEEVIRRGGTLARAGPAKLAIDGDPASDPAILAALTEHKAELLRLIDEREGTDATRPTTRAHASLTGGSGRRAPHEVGYHLDAAGGRFYQEFTAIRNVVFDEIMPALDPSAWMVLCLLIRLIDGYSDHRITGSGTVSVARIMEGTGLTRNTVKGALAALAGGGHIALQMRRRDRSATADPSITLTIPRPSKS